MEFGEFGLFNYLSPNSKREPTWVKPSWNFESSVQRRRAHTKKESYIAVVRLQLHYSSQHGLSEAVKVGDFSTFEMASYIIITVRLSQHECYRV